MLSNPHNLAFTDEILEAVEGEFTLLLSVSGGKDSDAMTWAVMDTARINNWNCTIELIHADLGSMEHIETPAYVAGMPDRFGAPLKITHRRRQGGEREEYLEQIKRRHSEGKIPFPSMSNRWCTSDNKRGPLDRLITPHKGMVIVAMGMRAEESPSRAKKPVSRIRPSKKPTKTRTVLDWLPIKDWREDDVWYTIKHTGDGLYHPMYDGANTRTGKGNDRLSCVICIFGSEGDLINGAYAKPDIYRQLCQIELESNYSWQPNQWLCDIAPDLLTSSQKEMRLNRG